MKKLLQIITLVASLLFATVTLADTFQVRKIQVEGLQRISAGTVYSYLPVKEGETFNTSKSPAVIDTLYKTGFFEHIDLARDGNVLIVTVVERPTIGQIKTTGNSVLATDKLNEVMKSVDVAEGRVYNSAILEKIKQSLLSQYYKLGRYNARVDVTVTPAARNRVLIKIDISEGNVAIIRQINIIGNDTFPSKALQKEMTISTPGWLSFITHDDQYSLEKLEASLENLRSYYMDRGYIKFTVRSAQVSITPDRKSVFITIAITEGAQYRIKGFDLTGDLILPKAKLMSLVTIKPNDIFSRKAIIDTEKAISGALGDEGYAFALINVQPNIDDNTKLAFLNFVVKPGKRVYVHHIVFGSNAKTNDEVLRREIPQMEGGVVSTGKLDEGKHRLKLLPFLRDVDMTMNRVTNTDDQVDVNYKVTEDPAAQATFSVGYSQLEGIIFGAGFNQKNFLGTGKTLGVNFSHSAFQQFYGITYTDPYFTADGISRTTSLSASRTNPGQANITNSYNLDEYSATDIFSIPIGAAEKGVYNRLQLGYGYQNTQVHTTSSVSTEVANFVGAHGTNFQQAQLIAGLTRDSRDKAIFPTSGTAQSLGLDLYAPIKGSLSYYTLSYNAQWYHPLIKSFIATARGTAAYGSGYHGISQYPFFKNFYAGGMGSVRGYRGNTLGPRDSNGDPFGGNALFDVSGGIIFPNYISDNLRTTWFVDGGNVFNSGLSKNDGGINFAKLRYSTGIEADWLTPVGLIDLSLAKGLNMKAHDDSEPFQFSLGANFG